MAEFNVNWEGIMETEELSEEQFLEKFGINQSDFDAAFDSPKKMVKNDNSEVGQGLSESAKKVINFIESQENASTSKKTLLDVKKFQRFLEARGEERPFHVIEPDQLDELIANFVLSARKADGSEYEPCSLRNIIASLDRRLCRAKYPYSIFRESGPAFQLTRDSLKAKQKLLKKMGKGNKPQSASAITDDEIEILYKREILGDKSPSALLNTMWLNNTIYFGLRGVKENYDLRWGDVTLNTSSNGLQYLQLNERQTKTRTGENIGDTRVVQPKMFATPDNPARDPVRLYKVYASRRPEDFSHPEDPFYIAPRTVPVTDSAGQWFQRQQVGQKKLSGLVKSMASQGQLDESKRLTNHSARKHLVQKLRNAGVAPTTIMQISGHRNIQSVLNYSEMTENEQISCSNILSNSTGHVKSVHSHSSIFDHQEPSATCSTGPMTPVSAPTATVTESLEQTDMVKSMFAGATVHITNFNVHLK